MKYKVAPLKKGYFAAQSFMVSGPDNPWKFRDASFCFTSRKEAKSYLEKAKEWVDEKVQSSSVDKPEATSDAH